MNLSFASNSRGRVGARMLASLSEVPESSPPPPLLPAKFKNNCFQFNSCSNDRSREQKSEQSKEQKSERVQQPAFKIRTCSHRPQNTSGAIVGRQLLNMVPLQNLKLDNQEDFHTLVVKRFSGHNAPPELPKKERLDLRKERDQVFDKITLLRQPELTHLQFKFYDCRKLLPLARRTELLLNTIPTSERLYALVFSVGLLVTSPRKYPPNGRGQSARVAPVDESFSGDAASCLRALLGTQKHSSFLNHCDLFLKVSGERELNQLSSFLQEHGLSNYAGIINAQSKFAQPFCFSLRDVVRPEQSLIYVQEASLLSEHVPLLSGVPTVFLVPRGSSLLGLAQALRGIRKEPVQSPSKKPRTSQITEDSDKENMSPNSSLLRNWSNQGRLSISGKTRQCSIGLGAAVLFQKAQLAAANKLIRQRTRASCSISSSEVPFSDNKEGKIRALSREKRQKSQENSQGMEAGFKDKMQAYVRILEAEKREKAIPKKSWSREGQLSQVQELTEVLTSGLVHKTGYQLVGDLLRNNAHIARQVGRHLSHTAVLRDLGSQLRELGVAQEGSGLFQFEWDVVELE